MTTEEFGLREGDRADNAAVREIMDAMQQAAMRHPAFNPDNMERYMAIALAASATLSGAIFGQMIALGMVDDTAKQKRIGREGVARNFNLGIPMGMDITARAMRGVGASQ